jgi:hypothetical protein
MKPRPFNGPLRRVPQTVIRPKPVSAGSSWWIGLSGPAFYEMARQRDAERLGETVKGIDK